MPTPDRTPPTDATASDGELSDRDRAILTFERDHVLASGLKANAINERFGLSTTRYYQRLREIVRTPAALEFDPLTTKRLLRLAASRARSRSAKRLPR